MNYDNMTREQLIEALEAVGAGGVSGQRVTQPAEPSDAEIREVFLANGFTIRPGHGDLKPYVYQAARALITRYGAQP